MAESKPELETGSDELDKHCDACRIAGETKTAIVFCKTCRQFQCETCGDMHKRLPTLSDHSLVDIQEIGGDKVVDMKGIDICKTHNNEIKFYCKTHSALCCDKCIVSAHLKCNDVGELGEFTQSNEENLKDLQRRIQAKLFKINVDKTTIPRVKAKLRKGQEDGLRELGEMKGKVTSAFNLMKKEYKSKSDKAISDTCKQLDSKMEKNLQIDENLRSTETFLNDVATSGTSEQMFNILCAISKDLDKLPQNDQEPLSICKINFKFNEKLLAMRDKIGTISIEKMKVYGPLALHSPVLADVPQPPGGQTPLISGLDFLYDGRIIAVDNSNYKLFAFDDLLTQFSTCAIKADKPLDVTVMSEDRVVISHGKTISMYKVNTDNSLTYVKHLITKESYYSVSVLDEQTLVAGTYDCDIPAKLVTLEGVEKDFDVLLPTRRTVFNQSRSTYIPYLNILVLTDRQSNKCHLWNVKDGTEVVVEDDRIKSPGGVCATPSGHIFICCYDNGQIVQLSPTGKIVGCTSISVNQHEYFISVTVSRNGRKLIVSIFNDQRQNCKIKMFTLA